MHKTNFCNKKRVWRKKYKNFSTYFILHVLYELPSPRTIKTGYICGNGFNRNVDITANWDGSSLEGCSVIRTSLFLQPNIGIYFHDHISGSYFSGVVLLRSNLRDQRPCL